MDGLPPSPSGGSDRLLLEGIISPEAGGGTGYADEVSTLPAPVTIDTTGAESTPVLRMGHKIHDESNDSSSSSDCGGSPFRKHGKRGEFCDHRSSSGLTPADFLGVPKKMLLILQQSGQGLVAFFEPLQLDIMAVPEVKALLKHYRSDI